jgi:hypothetical protein
MKYSTPELVVLGAAAVLVLGDIEGRLDNVSTFMTRPPAGVALGLDD